MLKDETDMEEVPPPARNVPKPKRRSESMDRTRDKATNSEPCACWLSDINRDTAERQLTIVPRAPLVSPAAVSMFWSTFTWAPGVTESVNGMIVLNWRRWKGAKRSGIWA